MVVSVPLCELTDRLASASHPTTITDPTTHHQVEHLHADSDTGSLSNATHEKDIVEDHRGNEETAVEESATLPGMSPVRVSMDKKQDSVLKKPVAKLMTVEERGEGAVGWGVYKSYFQAANKPLLIVCLLLSFVLGKPPYCPSYTNPTPSSAVSNVTRCIILSHRKYVTDFPAVDSSGLDERCGLC